MALPPYDDRARGARGAARRGLLRPLGLGRVARDRLALSEGL